MRRRDLTRLPVRHRLSATERASASRNGFAMSDVMPRLNADAALYKAANDALRALRDDLVRRARHSGDFRLVAEFGENLMRYSASTVSQAAGLTYAAEVAYRTADDLVAASVEGGRQ